MQRLQGVCFGCDASQVRVNQDLSVQAPALLRAGRVLHTQELQKRHSVPHSFCILWELLI